MRYCQIYDFRELGRITLRQYAMMMKAVRLQKLDKERDIHMQAWANREIEAKKTKGTGKHQKTVYVYKTFGSFFDYQKLEGEMVGEAKKKDADPFKIMLLKANTSKKP